MVRCITFGLLAVFVVLGTIKVGLGSRDEPDLIPIALTLIGWLAMFRLCDQGKFADHLTGVDEEAPLITWPNRLQVVHAAKVGVSLMVILAVALYFLDSLVSFSLDVLG
ncbi:preprotein translocase subunit SecE [Pirellulales bacterium]|nr:preprotein translocase subunit SecE [Pirellulales bacterium]